MKQLYYIKGNWFSRRSFIKQIKKQIKDYNLYVFDDEHSFKYILNIIKELDCFNEFKLIIINDWPKFKNKSKSQIRKLFIKNIIGKIPNNCCVIFNNLETRSKKFIDAVKENGEFHSFKNELNRNEIIKLIKNFFANREKQIQDDIICFLVDSITVMNSTIKTEKLILLLKQIEHLIGKKKNVYKKDIISAYIHMDDFIIWHLFDLLDKKNISDSTYLIQNKLDSSSNPKGEAFSILSVFLWRYQLLLLLKECQKEKIDYKGTNELISSLEKLKTNGSNDLIFMTSSNTSKYSKKVVYMTSRKSSIQIQNYTYQQLLLINYAINHAINKIREVEVETDNSINVILKIVCLVIINKINKISSLRMLKKSLYEVV